MLTLIPRFHDPLRLEISACLSRAKQFGKPGKFGHPSLLGSNEDGEEMPSLHSLSEYDPETERWISKDPIRFEGGDTNLYGYVL